MNLDIHERQAFVRMLAARIAADNQAAEELSEALRRR